MTVGGKGKAKGKASKATKQTSRSSKAGIHFPVGRIARFLRQGRYAQRVGTGTPVYLAAVLEYLTAEVLELSGNAAKNLKKTRIVPRCIFMAVKEDPELDQLLSDAIIANGGAREHIDEFLYKPKHKASKAAPAGNTA